MENINPLNEIEVERSNIFKEIFEKKVNDYKNLEESISNLVETDKYENLWDNKEKDVFEFAKAVISCVEPNENEIYESTPINLGLFLQWASQTLPKKTKTVLSQTWPPVIHKTLPIVESYIHLLLWMLKESNDPENLLRWFCFSFPPIKLSKNSISHNTDLLASCLVNYKTKENRPLWAILDCENNFSLYRITTKEMILEKNFPIKSAKNENNKVIVKGNNDEECIFEPIDPKIATFWPMLFEKKSLSYLMFLGAFDNFCPPIIYQAYLSALTSIDGILIRSLLSSIIIPETDQSIKHLFNVLLYSKKQNNLLNIICGLYFENFELLPNSSLNINSHLGILSKLYFEKFSGDYIQIFLKNLIIYIGNQQDLLIDQPSQCDLKKLEIVINTTLKYIIESLPFIKKEIKHLASYIRSFTIIRFNSIGAIYNILSEFFGIGFICSILDNFENYFNYLNIIFKNNIKNISNLLRIIFKLGVFNNEFSILNKRLQKHIYPKLIEFFISVADLGKLSPKYEIPEQNIFLTSIQYLMLKNSENHRSFLKYIELIKTSKRQYSGMLGWNLAISLSNFFKHSFDDPDVPENLRGKRQKINEEINNNTPQIENE